MDSIKILVLALLVLAAAWLGYQYLDFSGKEQLKLGNEVNGETFATILADSSNVYIVMDVRGVDEQVRRKNILQCGVDFAGSPGLVGKNLTIFSLDDDQGCIGMDRNHPFEYCFSQMENGIALYVEEGNVTKFYTNALKVGMGESYEVGACSVNVK